MEIKGDMSQNQQKSKKEFRVIVNLSVSCVLQPVAAYRK